ncbi:MULTISPECIES: hypothetical protein [unclassified Streptomyces]|uniref:hypothetical protein n=1 Tax=unclassified Streptomyces TaxID=2593676 RepID=UPI0006AD91B3|nr:MULTISPECIES: hypothetical protein [unclassified Streptomyces]
MADLDPTALPPELADPADIEALNDIARETGTSAAEMIRDAIHKAVLAHRVWDTPFFDNPHINRPEEQETDQIRSRDAEDGGYGDLREYVDAYHADLPPSEGLRYDGADWIVYTPDRTLVGQAKAFGERLSGSGHALAAAKEISRRNPEGWQAVRTLLLESRGVPIKQRDPDRWQRAHHAVRNDPELRELLKEMNEAAEALRHRFDTEGRAPLLLVERPDRHRSPRCPGTQRRNARERRFVKLPTARRIVMADTSAVLAGYDTGDKIHKEARNVLDTAATLVMSPLVLAELDHLARDRLGYRVAMSMLDELQQRMTEERLVVPKLTSLSLFQPHICASQGRADE